MKFLIVFVALFAVALAEEVPIVRSEVDIEPNNYSFDWATNDGQAAQAKGELKNVGTDQEALSVQGSYRYVDNDGVEHSLSYIADENGFQPQSADLPVPVQA
ncbi:larval cuticle protein 65Ag1-like [Drosophila eugracilis]|uniref:larval cuticle protein 65Ag1-like n=1 Tax=Drosophila eugracilis TaxID=29029 RepID=UPI0007E63E85|nr:larval cuticle protein 65Ag1-like [Drosophila eugracilis]